jgi:glycosyltransferase involved in cell wall biosynthesis
MGSKYNKNVFVIPNLLGEETKDIWNAKSNTVKIFSRFTEQKGIDLAITAWSLLPKNFQEEYQLEIYGDGDRSRYSELVSKLNLDYCIKLNGPTKNMHQELSDCLLYVLPSRFEGFPNALAESMGFGIPAAVAAAVIIEYTCSICFVCNGLVYL